jgi:hypothetical protein
MKTLAFAITLLLTVVFSIISAAVGLGIMAYDLYSGGSQFMHGFTVFSLGAILFFVSTTAYIATKILTNTDILADSMIKFFEHEMGKEEAGLGMNPLQALFGKMGMGLPGMGAGSIKMARMDEDGNITPLGEKTFSSHEELIKHRDELLQKAFGAKPGKKDIKEMSLEELEVERQQAVDSQKFELAAAIRDLIEEKKKNK